jgi:hypothetical protein
VIGLILMKICEDLFPSIPGNDRSIIKGSHRKIPNHNEKNHLPYKLLIHQFSTTNKN